MKRMARFFDNAAQRNPPISVTDNDEWYQLHWKAWHIRRHRSYEGLPDNCCSSLFLTSFNNTVCAQKQPTSKWADMSLKVWRSRPTHSNQGHVQSLFWLRFSAFASFRFDHCIARDRTTKGERAGFCRLSATEIRGAIVVWAASIEQPQCGNDMPRIAGCFMMFAVGGWPAVLCHVFESSVPSPLHPTFATRPSMTIPSFWQFQRCLREGYSG